MEYFTMLGLLTNSADYNFYLHNEDTKTSYVGKLAIWYITTLAAIVASICTMFGL